MTSMPSDDKQYHYHNMPGHTGTVYITVDMLETDILNLFFSTNIFNDSPELGSAKMIEI